MGVPKFCLYMFPSNWKYVKLKINFKAFKNSSRGIKQLVAMCSHLFETLSMAKSSGIFVKREITSRNIKT